MKWFKHMSDMAGDVRVKRVIRKHGVEGYGLYVYIIERIVARLDTLSPHPDLEENAEDIAADTGLTPAKVEEIMWTCIEQGLFEQDEVSGRLTAHKVYKFLQQSETRSQEIRDMITAYKNSNITDIAVSQTVTDNCEEKNRIEEKRKEETTEELPNGRKSKLKDDIADLFERTFWAENGEPVSFAKERANCNRLAKVCRSRYPDDAEKQAAAILERFKRGIADGREWWADRPFTASALVSVFDHVAKDAKPAEATPYTEIPDFMREVVGLA